MHVMLLFLSFRCVRKARCLREYAYRLREVSLLPAARPNVRWPSHYSVFTAPGFDQRSNRSPGKVEDTSGFPKFQNGSEGTRTCGQ